MRLIIASGILFILTLFCVAEPLRGQQPKAGLYFFSHNSNIDQRTGLTLNNGQPYIVKSQDSFTVEFDVFLRNEAIKFGYVFRIISNTNENFDFIVNNARQAFLVVNNRDYQLPSPIQAEQWNHVAISFQKKRQQIFVRLNDDSVRCQHSMDKLTALTVSFGRCDNLEFLANDVAPIILKDIGVFFDNKKTHQWELNKHAKNKVYDEQEGTPAMASNPGWMINNSVYWEKVAEFQTSLFPQVTFDSINSIVYMLNPNELISYSLQTHTERRTKTSPEIMGKYYNHLMFDPVKSRLFFYHVETNQIYFYDPETNIWLNYHTNEKDPAYAHHSRYISAADSCLYLFGGYGFYKFNSDFFKINLQSKEMFRYDLSRIISPRYLAAMGGIASGDKLYILGGRGSETGRQELSPKNFSNLFEIELKTLKTTYLFDIDNKGNIYSNSLIVDSAEKNIYVLAYPNKKYTSSIFLQKINLTTKTVETLADSIEYYFQDITSFCDLYYAPKLSKLVAIAAFPSDTLTSRINIYTLDYPPLTEWEILQQTTKHSTRWVWLASLSVLLVLSLCVWMKKRRNKRKQQALPVTELPAEEPAAVPERSEIEIGEFVTEKTFYSMKNKSILFLGGFQVFDKDGKNITGEFTPTLKHVLVLIILSTFMKNSKGISSSRLQELLWFDKEGEAARNNRNVNLRRLRLLLAKVGVDISNRNKYWTIILPDDVLSDYREILRLANSIPLQNGITQLDDLLRLLELLNNGSLLPNVQEEWIDDFKTEFSNLVIDSLFMVINNPKNSFYENEDIRLRVANALLEFDSINEDAIQIKCKALVKMGKKGLAKTVFDNFNKEYKLILGESYTGSIKKIME
ncbi:MAG: hypothetical protein LBD45_00845 [Bacteroidales bacterium]|jgi:DNA-binding SARP family transcriptional activator|nr:hypothetical protein [Bacteroidales bacterium]